MCIDVLQTEWAFGTGLTYSSFEVSNLLLSSQAINETGSLTVSVTVTNTGSSTGKYSVLLFVSQMFRRVTPEYKLLKRFSKVELAAGEAVVVVWELSAAIDLVYIGMDARYSTGIILLSTTL
jgi:beta-glucosidase